MTTMMPSVAKDPKDWSIEERFYVMTHRFDWITLCYDHYEQELKNKKLLDFLESKNKKQILC